MYHNNMTIIVYETELSNISWYLYRYVYVYIYIYIKCQSVSEAALAVYAKISWPRAQVLLTQLVPWQRRQEQLDTAAGFWHFDKQ